MTEITGGQLIARALKAEGVEKVFGIIDGTYTQLLAGFVEQGIDLLTPRHEATAAHMAGAYARLTGKLGVCIASAGPGVANMLSGVAVEQVEGNRVLLITTCRRAPIVYPDRGGSFQCFDQVGVIRAMSNWSEAAPTFERIPELLRQALRSCYQGRPGVVHLDVPENLMNGKSKDPGQWKPEQTRNTTPLAPSPDAVEQAAEMLTKADLPMIHAGSGILHAGAFEELAELARLLHAPVITSWAARGVLPETDPLAWPMILMDSCNQVRNKTDVVLCLGSRLGETDWWGKAPNWAPPHSQWFIQIDHDPDALGRNRPVQLAVQADVRAFLRELLARLEPHLGKIRMDARHSSVNELAGARDRERAKLDTKLEDRSAPMLTAHVPRICRETFGDDAVAIFDGGNTAVWANYFHQVREPNTLLTGLHMGHLGAGVGQTLGACVARPEAQIYCITADGAMGFHPQEIETAVRHGLKPIYLVCCDRAWGMVKMTQSFALKPLKTMVKKSLGPDETINTELGEIEFDKLAEAMGAHGDRVSSPDELPGAIDRAVAADRCAVIHIDVDPVKHMWAPGLLHFKTMHQEPKGE